MFTMCKAIIVGRGDDMIISEQLHDAIDTERLHLRRFREDDWDDMIEYLSDPEVMKFEPFLTGEKRREWVATRITSNDFWAVCLADTGKMIGDIYMGQGEQNAWELGYIFNAKYQNQGYATEAAGALICRTFYVEGAHKICAFCNPDNVASWKLLERLGFCREGHLRKNTYVRLDLDGHPIWHDTFVYGMLHEEWENNHIHRINHSLVVDR